MPVGPRLRNAEEFHLRLVKGVVVTIMSLALLTVLGLLLLAAFQYLQAPKPPLPAQAAPNRTIKASDLKLFLQDEERRRQEQERRVKELGSAAAMAVPASQASSVLKFMAEATHLTTCLDSFKRLADLNVVPLTEAQQLEELNRLRNFIEQLAVERNRGDAWVTAMDTYVCQLLQDPALGQLRKDGKIGAAFYPAIRFHAAAWSRIASEREQFDAGEAARVSAQMLAERLRVEAAHATARLALIAAACVFAGFMLMALYLIFARIERNLAGIQLALKRQSLPG